MGENVWMNLTAEQAQAAFDSVKDKEGTVSTEALAKFQSGKDLTAEQKKLLPLQKTILSQSFRIQSEAPKEKTDDYFDADPTSMKLSEFMAGANDFVRGVGRSTTVFDATMIKRASDQEIIKSSGLFRAFGGERESRKLFGPGLLGTGIGDALKNLRDPLPTSPALEGLGYKGTGAGGGGTGLGIGGMVTHGAGHGTGGFGNVLLVDRKGKPIETPSTREQIERVMKRSSNQFAYHYGIEVQKNPHLAGRVVAHFVIDRDGETREVRIEDKGLNNATVIKGLTGVIERLRFPAPQEGKEIDVTYPFEFRVKGEPAPAATPAPQPAPAETK